MRNLIAKLGVVLVLSIGLGSVGCGGGGGGAGATAEEDETAPTTLDNGLSGNHSIVHPDQTGKVALFRPVTVGGGTDNYGSLFGQPWLRENYSIHQVLRYVPEASAPHDFAPVYYETKSVLSVITLGDKLYVVREDSTTTTITRMSDPGSWSYSGGKEVRISNDEYDYFAIDQETVYYHRTIHYTWTPSEPWNYGKADDHKLYKRTFGSSQNPTEIKTLDSRLNNLFAVGGKLLTASKDASGNCIVKVIYDPNGTTEGTTKDIGQVAPESLQAGTDGLYWATNSVIRTGTRVLIHWLDDKFLETKPCSIDYARGLTLPSGFVIHKQDGNTLVAPVYGGVVDSVCVFYPSTWKWVDMSYSVPASTLQLLILP